YEPPFRGRGIEKMPGEQPQFSELSIDWKHHEQLRKNEEDRLRTMEKFINSHGCRRGYILKYFGEAKTYSCGVCDRCVAKKAVSEDRNNLVKTEHRIALPVLGFLRFARFPLGKARIADVVTGSRNKQIIEWGLNKNPAYALVDATRAEVKEVIENLMNAGYVEVTGDSHLPVLRLTERGKKAALEFDPEDFDRITVRKAGASRKPDRISSGEEIGAAVLKCVDTVPYSIGTSKIAGVLTGSRAKWIEQSGVEDLEVYGSVNATQDDVKEIILEMIDDYSLQQKGSTLYPVLALTEKGRAKLKGGPKPETEGKTVEEAARGSSGTEEYVRVCYSPRPVSPLEALAGELLVARPEQAREMLPDVRKHKPEEIMDALINCSNDPECHGTRPRLIWCVGELCGGYGVDFLLDNLSSESSAIRKLTASALGKTGTRMKTGVCKDPLMTRKARQALELLAGDPNRQVRECAQKALKCF
ncbi:MAG: RecQ family zinc-binding domain-containing protein, partial [Actinobacteria bacterium]|nr:RecQ family zinc-binding domain-containing protein [Actinomycetota bacterium]